MPAQIFHVEHFQTAAFHPVDRLRQAGNPAAGENVLADVELGVEIADMADEVNDTNPAWFERGCVCRYHFGKLIAPRMFECTDRKHLVVLARDLAEVGFDNADFRVQTAARDVRAQLRDLLGSDVDSRTERAVMLPSMEEQATPTAADVNERFARLELNLATDVVEFVALSLLERAGTVAPVRAGIHHRLVEPVTIEHLTERVVIAGVLLCLG